MSEREFWLPMRDNAGRVDAFLRARGFTFEGVSVNGDTATIAGLDETAIEPLEKALAAYTSIPTDDEQSELDAITDGEAALAAIERKPRAQRTATERILLALALNQSGSTSRRVNGSRAMQRGRDD